MPIVGIGDGELGEEVFGGFGVEFFFGDEFAIGFPKFLQGITAGGLFGEFEVDVEVVGVFDDLGFDSFAFFVFVPEGGEFCLDASAVKHVGDGEFFVALDVLAGEIVNVASAALGDVMNEDEFGDFAGVDVLFVGGDNHGDPESAEMMLGFVGKFTRIKATPHAVDVAKIAHFEKEVGVFWDGVFWFGHGV